MSVLTDIGYRPVFALTLSAIALTSCTDEAEKSEPMNAEASPTPAASAEQPSATEAADEKEITLTSDGIILVNAVEGRGAATTLSFGMAQDLAIAAMEVDFGKPELSRNGECGAGPMEFAEFGALQLNFLDGKLAGWFAEPADNLVTSDGIRPGIPLAELKRERQVVMANDTLEGEFGYASPDGGDIGGFEGRDGKIISLNAGVNCFFR